MVEGVLRPPGPPCYVLDIMEKITVLVPYATKVEIKDPAPAQSTNAAETSVNPAIEQVKFKTTPGPSSAVSSIPPDGPSPDVIQRFRFTYRLIFVEELGNMAKCTLVVPLPYIIPGYETGCMALTLLQEDENGPLEVRVVKEGLQPILAFDGGPNFGEPVLTSVSARLAELEDGGIFKPKRSLGVRHSSDGPMFQILGFTEMNAILEMKMAIERRFPRNVWNYFSSKRTSQPMTALLENAERTGDLILSGEVSFLLNSRALVTWRLAPDHEPF